MITKLKVVEAKTIYTVFFMPYDDPSKGRSQGGWQGRHLIEMLPRIDKN